jgi:hypothetical protein
MLFGRIFFVRLTRRELRKLILESMFFPGGMSSNHPRYKEFLRSRREDAELDDESIEMLDQFDPNDPQAHAFADALGSIYEPSPSLPSKVSYEGDYFKEQKYENQLIQGFVQYHQIQSDPSLTADQKKEEIKKLTRLMRHYEKISGLSLDKAEEVYRRVKNYYLKKK